MILMMDVVKLDGIRVVDAGAECCGEAPIPVTAMPLPRLCDDECAHAGILEAKAPKGGSYGHCDRP